MSECEQCWGGLPPFDAGELDYELPESLIAQEPPQRRGESRLLVLERASGRVVDSTIGSLGEFLHCGDTLVLNDTRVLPAKFVLRRGSGGRVEGLFLGDSGGDSGIAESEWEVLLKGAGKVVAGEELTFERGGGRWVVRAVSRGDRGRWRVAVCPGGGAAEILNVVGRMPLPPYIKRDKRSDPRDGADCGRYQTVFASNDGAVAAPTAGLHFTEEMLGGLSNEGFTLAYVTLHVGYGTFAPLEVEDLAEHRMHSEYFSISDATAKVLTGTRAEGRRVVAVGTTSARVLETWWRESGWGQGGSGWTDLFCYPPYQFGGVDVLLTNFHLPRSTLLALVMAFAGKENIRGAYAHAIENEYRFFSYGDAMLIV